jgi:membrane protein YdbS with pleckstrin-like domain
MSSGRVYNMPKLLKSTYLADGETLLEETRATKLYYFPLPVLLLLIFGIFDLEAAYVTWHWGLSLPFLTDGFQGIVNAVPGTGLIIVLLFITLLLLLWLGVQYLRWISNVYAVTTSRVILQTGIFSRGFDEVPVHQVRGVDVHQSIVQRMFRYGTVRVSAEGGTSRSIGNEDWHGIPNPFKFQRVIESATQNLARANVTQPPTPTRT